MKIHRIRERSIYGRLDEDLLSDSPAEYLLAHDTHFDEEMIEKVYTAVVNEDYDEFQISQSRIIRRRAETETPHGRYRIEEEFEIRKEARAEKRRRWF